MIEKRIIDEFIAPYYRDKGKFDLMEKKL